MKIVWACLRKFYSFQQWFIRIFDKGFALNLRKLYVETHLVLRVALNAVWEILSFKIIFFNNLNKVLK